MQFLTFNMDDMTRCPLPQAISLPSVVGLSKTDGEQSVKMASILWNLKQLGRNFAPLSRTTQGMCMQNIIAISAIMRALELAQRFHNTCGGGGFNARKKYIGPTLHVGPKYIIVMITVVSHYIIYTYLFVNLLICISFKS